MCTLDMEYLSRVLQDGVGLELGGNVVPGRPPLFRGGGPPLQGRREAQGGLQRIILEPRYQDLVPGSEILEALLFCFLFEEEVLPPEGQDWAQIVPALSAQTAAVCWRGRSTFWS